MLAQKGIIRGKGDEVRGKEGQIRTLSLEGTVLKFRLGLMRQMARSCRSALADYQRDHVGPLQQKYSDSVATYEKEKREWGLALEKKTQEWENAKVQKDIVEQATQQRMVELGLEGDKPSLIEGLESSVSELTRELAASLHQVEEQKLVIEEKA